MPESDSSPLASTPYEWKEYSAPLMVPASRTPEESAAYLAIMKWAGNIAVPDAPTPRRGVILTDIEEP